MSSTPLLTKQEQLDHAFALVDCNNFFVSCERVFDSKLRNRPVVVLSSNDGCIISRSQEAKTLGIPMGAPAFKYEPLFVAHNIAVLSANFTLYVDISRRVMDIVTSSVQNHEIYSIDEVFLALNFLTTERPSAYARKIRKAVLQQTGIPVSIGIGRTKTLAKIANSIAKKDPLNEGVFALSDSYVDEILKKIQVGDIWGIGRNLAVRLQAEGIYNAYDLRHASDSLIRKKISISGLRTALELRGLSCIDLHNSFPKKTITSSRSFGKPVECLQELEEAIAVHASRVAEKLRQEGLCARILYAYIRTSYHRNIPRYSSTQGVSLIVPSAHTPTLIDAAQRAVRKGFQPSYQYVKAGIIAADLVSDRKIQQALFLEPQSSEREETLMFTLDKLNRTHGKRALFFGAVGISQSWRSKQTKRSKRFTTCWNDLPLVKA